MKRITKKKINIKKILIPIIIIILIFTSYKFISNIIYNYNQKENITTKLKTEKDFLNWFIDFNNLYNQKVKNINYSVTTDMFQKINNYLNEENNTDIYYKDNTYYIDKSNTIELDVNTRSFRYTKFKDDNKIEILEVNLINGKYYVQLINEKYIYKIKFNKNNIKKKKTKNKDNLVIINNSIYGTNNFNW